MNRLLRRNMLKTKDCKKERIDREINQWESRLVSKRCVPVSEPFEMLMGKARFSLKQLTEDEKKQGKRQDCSSKLVVESRLASRKNVKGR